MKLEQPDRVPLMCQFSFGFMNQQLKEMGISPMEMWLDANKYAQGLMILRDRFNFDGILVSIHGHFENWRSKIKKVEDQNGIDVATYSNRRETFLEDDLPLVVYFKAQEEEIESFDLDSIQEEIDYIPSAKTCLAFIDLDNPFWIFDILDEKVKNKFSIHGEITSPFDYFLNLLGYESALTALLTHPDKCKQILQKFTVGLIKLLNGMCRKNIDAVKISSPFAGMGFIAPEQYLEFEQPFIQQLTKVISRSGKYSYIHTCGHIGDRLEYMKKTGAKGLECLDPPPIGNVDLQDAFQRIGTKMFIKGNIDPVNTLNRSTKEAIEDDVRKRLEIGKRNPGFILSSACSISPKTPAANIQLLHELVEQYGYYD